MVYANEITAADKEIFIDYVGNRQAPVQNFQPFSDESVETFVGQCRGNFESKLRIASEINSSKGKRKSYLPISKKRVGIKKRQQKILPLHKCCIK